MAKLDPLFWGLTPEDVFNENTLVDESAYQNEILPHFDAYMDSMAELPEYADIHDAFVQGSPDTLEAFKHRLSFWYGDVNKDWNPHSTPGADNPTIQFTEFLYGDGILRPEIQKKFSQHQERYNHILKDWETLVAKTADFNLLLPLMQSESDTAHSQFEAFRSTLEELRQKFLQESREGCDGIAEQISAEFALVCEDLQNWMASLVTDRLLNKSEYDAFEKALMPGIYAGTLSQQHFFSDEFEIRIRKKGRKLFGVSSHEERLERQYGISIETENLNHAPAGTLPNSVSCSRESVSQLAFQMENLETELQKYPPGFIQDSGLDKIFIVSGLRQGSPDRKIMAIQDGNIMVIESILGSFDHELFHAMDFQDGLTLDDAWWGVKTDGMFYDADWRRFQTGSKMPGFASEYAFTETERRQDASDDQSETAERLFDDYQSLQADIRHDPVLAAKVSLLKDFYYAKSYGQLDETYWNDLASQGQLTQDYWIRCVDADYLSEARPLTSPSGATALAVSGLVERGRELSLKGRNPEALEFLSKAHSLDPENFLLLESLAILSDAVKNTEDAQYYAEQAILKGSRSTLVFNLLERLYGDACLASGNDPVIDGLQRLIDTGSNNPELYRFLARRQTVWGERREALYLYESYISSCDETQPEHSYFILYYLKFLKETQSQFTDHEWRQALDFCVANLSYEDPLGAFFGSLSLLNEFGRHQDVLHLLESSLKSHPQDQYLKQFYAEQQRILLTSALKPR